uniref:Uncharacterized protein n=1 Tax=Ixodes ricinus TaxID=34613 RepID=A0A0K8RHX3_IXORI
MHCTIVKKIDRSRPTLPRSCRLPTPVSFRLLVCLSPPAGFTVFSLALTLHVCLAGSQYSARPLAILLELSVTLCLFVLAFVLRSSGGRLLLCLCVVLRLPLLDPCPQSVPLPVWARSIANKSAGNEGRRTLFLILRKQWLRFLSWTSNCSFFAVERGLMLVYF